MDYINKFNNRIEKFIYAVNTYPHCMENEFKTAINILDLKDNETLVNLGGGGLDLSQFINKKIKYIPFDFSPQWTQFDKNVIHISTNKIPLPDKSVDKIIILAVLHHFTNQERNILYQECHRILKKTGKFIIADVIKNSTQDIWLNTFVNKFNPFGHKGIFFDLYDSELIKSNNFTVNVEKFNYTWWFNNENEMIDYLKNLFFLNITDNELISHTYKILQPYSSNNKIQFNWQLIYFICTPN